VKLHESQAIRWDCRHYRGDRPCAFNRTCHGCGHYSPYAERVCVVKFGALGDVIRTLCILPELRRRYPDGQITWVTRASAAKFIESHPLIDRVVAAESGEAAALPHERFDLVIGLDKEPEPCALTMNLTAEDKLGIGLSPAGTPAPINAEAEAYFLLGLSDELKFHENTKSYPRLIYEALGWRYGGQRYTLAVTEPARQFVREKLAVLGRDPDRPTVGVNVGAADRFVNKSWPESRLVDLIRELYDREPELQVLLLGGPDEDERMYRLNGMLPWTIHTDSDNTAEQFVALVDQCDTVFTGDTLALHVAVARRRGVVAFFGPTCDQEIDLFGRGEKLISTVACRPCYRGQCPNADACAYDVPVEQAIGAILRTTRFMTDTPVVLAAEDLRKAG